ncbi:MAG: hybrid sensor histidine kinase/response regulator [bacterium]|nr:hybrid sensor histidine kinase/response regulator [bacterium]
MDILLVDDEEHILRSVGDFLTDFGHRVMPAGTGEEALKLLAQGTDVGLIISDIRMPGMDGFEFLQAVRTRYAPIPGILITGHQEEHSLLKTLRCGAYEYLRKPIRLKYLLACIDEVDASRRLGEQLVVSRRMLGIAGASAPEQVVRSGLAYEIQVPLGAAREALQRMGIFWKSVQNDLASEDARDHLGTVQDEVAALFVSMEDSLARMYSIVQDLEALAGTHSPPVERRVNLSGCLMEAAEKVGATLFAGVHPKWDFDDDALYVLGDRRDFLHLFSHLLDNAARAVASSQEAEVHVRVRREDVDQVRIEVHDNGCGMSEEVRARAFEAFFTTRPEGESLGVGLPVCQEIVRRHGGEIGFEDDKKQGTTFWIRLRRAPE